jgi:ABC-type uncharacterized transport system involved in gliding motility auxiliary subunit
MGQQGMFNLVQAYPYWPIVFPAGEHATTRDLQRMSLGWASPLEIVPGGTAVPLWATTEAAALQDSGTPVAPGIQGAFSQDPEDFQVRVVAAAVAPELATAPGDAPPMDVPQPTAAPPGRLVVVGDVDFLSDNFVSASPQNLFFGANAVDWLAQDEALIGIRSKNRMPPPLVFPSEGIRSLVRWGSLAGAPLVLVLVGLVRVGGRRRRAERRWGEVLA